MPDFSHILSPHQTLDKRLSKPEMTKNNKVHYVNDVDTEIDDEGGAEE